MNEQSKSYDYAKRHGNDRVTWERFHDLSRTIAEQLAVRDVDIILGIARAGLFPATAVACALRVELYPVRLSRREGDTVKHESPQWHVHVPEAVAGKRVAIVDEMTDTGETLRIATAAARDQGAKEVVTASLFAHTWAIPQPDIVAQTTDALIVFPWDAEVLINGKWAPHPDLEAFLNP